MQFRGGSFDPIQQADMATPLQQSYAEINQGWANYYQGARYNDRRRIEIAGKDVDALANLSGKLGEYVEAQLKEKRAAEKAEAYNEYYEKGLDPEAIEEHKKSKEVLVKQMESLEGIANDMQKQNTPQEVIDRFLNNMSPAKRYFYIEAWTRDQAQQYNPDEDPAVAEATTTPDRMAALRAYRQNFYKRFEGINPAILNETVFPEQQKIEQKSANKWNANQNVVRSNNREEQSKKQLITGVQQGNAQAILDYSTMFQSKHGGLGLAREKAMEYIKENIDVGLITSDNITDMGETMVQVPGAPKGTMRPFKDVFTKDYKTMLQQLDTYEKAESDRIEDRKTVEKRADENAVIGQLREIGATFNEARTAGDLYEQKHGVRSDAIDKFAKNLSVEGRELTIWDNHAEDLARFGLLTEEKLAEMPYQIQQKYQSMPGAVNKTAASANDTYIKSIEDLVKSHAKGTVAGNYGQTVRLKTAQLQSDYLQTLQKYKIAAATDPEKYPNPEMMALEEVTNRFEAWIKIPGNRTKKGYKIFDSPETVIKNSATANQIIDRVNTMLNSGEGLSILDKKILNDAGEYDSVFWTKEELIDMESQFKPGYSNATAEYIGKSFSPPLDQFAVINKAREAADLKPLNELPSFRWANKEIHPSLMRVLCDKDLQTDQSVCRAIGSAKSGASVLVDKGEELTQEANANNIPTSNVLAAYELIKMGYYDNRNLPGSDNFKMDGDWSRVFWSHKFKYGETPEDKIESLDNLRRFTKKKKDTIKWN